MNVRVHQAGNWNPSQVRADWVPSSRPIIEDVERLIGAAWNAAKSRPGVMLFDGPMCRLESVEATPDALRLRLSRTSYKTFLGTNLTNPELAERYGPEILANPVGVSAALVTADDRLLLGRRGPAVAYYPNRVHPFAGALEPHDPVDVFAEVGRELREELSLAAADLGEVRCIGLIEDVTLRQPELVFHVRAAHPHEALIPAVDAAEHEGTVVLEIDADVLRRALRDPSYTPVAVGTVALLGRERFGEAWFDGALRAE
jgi:hypothetical protein